MLTSFLRLRRNSKRKKWNAYDKTHDAARVEVAAAGCQWVVVTLDRFPGEVNTA